MKRIFKNKKIIVVIICLLLLGTGIFLYINKDLKEEVNGLEVIYFGRDKVKFKKVDKGFVYEKKIVIKNTSSDLRTYSLEWIDIENSFKNQYSLLYEIESTGERSANLEKSQLPGADSVIFPQVAILPGKTHTYKIKIWYEGKGEKSQFVGRVKVLSEKIIDSESNNKKNEI